MGGGLVDAKGDVAVRIELTQGRFAIVDAGDAPALLAYSRQASKSDRMVDSYETYYARRAERGPDGKPRYVQMHRQIMDAPEGVEVDHRDGDGLNNRRYNLRVCTHAQNGANQRIPKNNRSGFKGVYRQKDCDGWCAKIRSTYLGLYDSAEEAARAYDTAAVRTFGEFASLNFPDDFRAVEPNNNGLNRRSTSGFVGVNRAIIKGKLRWLARIYKDGKLIHVGTFKTPEEAAAAREARLTSMATDG
jgi:hypothetical protein